jgi:hypothetical protein
MRKITVSATMRTALAIMKDDEERGPAHAGDLVRRPGGFWSTRATKDEYHTLTGMVPAWWVGAQTVQAMEQRGLVERCRVTDKEWADDRRLTPLGIQVISAMAYKQGQTRYVWRERVE